MHGVIGKKMTVVKAIARPFAVVIIASGLSACSSMHSLTGNIFKPKEAILPGERVDPYLLGGVSYVWVDEDEIDVDSDASGYIGAGLDIQLGDANFLLFGEALYRFNELETEFEEDIDVSGFTGNVGIKVRF